MKKYKHMVRGAGSTQRKKDNSDRPGFYIALAVCMVAVGLAVWSAYTTLDEKGDVSDGRYFASLSSATAPAAHQLEGVTEAPTPAATVRPTQAPTQAPTRAKGITIYETSAPTRAEDAEREAEISSLQAVLKVTDSLVYPVKSRSVLKQYSEDAVFSSTMRDLRAHTGCDFVAEEGESVYAMCAGTVKDISVSELYGVIAEVESDGFSVYYCGLDPDLNVDKGDELDEGDTIGTVAQIPCESADDPHIHIEIRVGNRLIDPLSVINNNS